jgi:hypothetical protein
MAEFFHLETPVVFLVFNRPGHTSRVFEEIRRARPPRLYVVGDGPRPDRTDDVSLVQEVRSIIAQGVDWPCEVRTNYAEANLGCGRRVSSGLDWVFAQEPEVIVLEDDCLPDPTFFRFCSELLARYRDDAQVGMISGCNFQDSPPAGGASFYYSAYNHVWGWAAWRRSWQLFDWEMARWPGLRSSAWPKDFLGSRLAAIYWRGCFDKAQAGQIDTWAYRWAFSLWAHGVLTVLPAKNLVTNIGFDSAATHFSSRDEGLSHPSHPMRFPLNFPDQIVRDIKADHFTEQHLFNVGWERTIKNYLKRVWRSWLRRS